jgi:phospholipid N-methyltransferase
VDDVLADFRKKYPQYNDMGDQKLAGALYSKYYSDISEADYYAKIGMAAPVREPEPVAADDPEYQSFLEATGTALGNVPERLQMGVAGLIQMSGEGGRENIETYINAEAKRLDLEPGYLADLIRTGEWEGYRDQLPEETKRAMAIPPSGVDGFSYARGRAAAHGNMDAYKGRVQTGIDMRADATGDLNPVNAEPGSAAHYGSSAIGSIAEMMPALTASIFTRKPSAAMSIMGGQVLGQEYGEKREDGVDQETARNYAMASAAAEAIPEALPLGFLLKEGVSFIRRGVGGAAAEGLQEMVTEAIKIGLDKGILDQDTTWGEARHRLLEAGIVGTLAGGGMGLIVSGVDAAGEKASEGLDRAMPGRAVAREMKDLTGALDDMPIDTTQAAADALDPANAQIIRIKAPEDMTMGELVAEKRARIREEKHAGAMDTGLSGQPDIDGTGSPEPGLLGEDGQPEIPGADDIAGTTEGGGGEGIPVSEPATEPEPELDPMVETLEKAKVRAGKSEKAPSAWSGATGFLQYMKKRGGIKVGSQLHKALLEMGMSHRQVPGLFKKDGNFGDADNIAVTEFRDEFGFDPVDGGGGYVDRGWILERIEARDIDYATPEDKAAEEASLDAFEAGLYDLGLSIDDSIDVIRARVAEAENEWADFESMTEQQIDAAMSNEEAEARRMAEEEGFDYDDIYPEGEPIGQEALATIAGENQTDKKPEVSEDKAAEPELSEYEKALRAHDEASQKYRTVQKRYNSGEMSDDIFDKEKAKFDAATEIFDAAFEKEQNKPKPKKAPEPVSDDLFGGPSRKDKADELTRKTEGRKRSEKPQESPDGLFDTEARKQTDLVDMAKEKKPDTAKEETAKPEAGRKRVSPVDMGTVGRQTSEVRSKRIGAAVNRGLSYVNDENNVEGSADVWKKITENADHLKAFEQMVDGHRPWTDLKTLVDIHGKTLSEDQRHKIRTAIVNGYTKAVEITDERRQIKPKRADPGDPKPTIGKIVDPDAPPPPKQKTKADITAAGTPEQQALIEETAKRLLKPDAKGVMFSVLENEAHAKAFEEMINGKGWDDLSALVSIHATSDVSSDRSFEIVEEIKSAATTAKANISIAERKAAKPEAVEKPVRDYSEPLKAADEFNSALDREELTAADIVADMEALLAAKDDIIARFKSREFTKKQLDRVYGGMRTDLKKDQLAEGAFDRLVRDHILADAVMTVMGAKSFTDQVIEQVKAQTDADVKAYYEKRREQKATNEKNKADRKKAIDNPETLAEFQLFIRMRGKDKLTPEQLAAYDELAGTKQKEKPAKPAPKVEGVEGEIAYTKGQTVHSKTGADLFVISLVDRVSKDQYRDLNAKAKALGGYYSKWNKGDAIPGFQFKTEEARDQFAEVLSGETVEKATPEAVKPSGQKLIDMADKMEAKAQEDLQADRIENTARQSSQAASSREGARKKIALAKTLRDIGERISDGSLTWLEKLSASTQLETLMSIQKRAIPSELFEGGEYDGYSISRTLKKGVGIDDYIKYVRFPRITVSAETMERTALKLEDKPGFKQVAEKLRKLPKHSKGEHIRVLSEDLLPKLKAAIKRGHIDEYDLGGWTLEQEQQINRLRRMGIETEEQLRAAIRELESFRAKPEEESPIKKLERSLKGKLIEGYFPTPRPLVENMLYEADIDAGMSVLEPEAGKGDIAEVIREQQPEAQLSVIEYNTTLNNILQEKGFDVVGSDFLEHEGGYDRIIMNPPFERFQDVEHVRHAYDLLNPGGRLVAIMGASVNNSRKTAVEFREWLDDKGGYITENPEGSFKSSDRPTGVSTVTVVLDKQGEGVSHLVHDRGQDGPASNSQPLYRAKGMPERPESGYIVIGDKSVKLPPENKPVRREGIQARLEGIVGPRIYTKIKGGTKLGHYRHDNGEVRIKDFHDVEVLAHEMAHYLDFHHKYKRQFQRLYKQKGLKNEVTALSYTSNPKLVETEGFAEFVRLWLTQYDVAMDKAPNFTRAFEALLKKDRALNNNMKILQKDMHVWFYQGDMARLEAVTSGNQYSAKERLTKFTNQRPADLARQRYIDHIHGARVAETASKGELSDATESAYKQLQLLNGVSAIFEESMERGALTIDEDGNMEFVGPSLRDVWHKSITAGERRLREQEMYFAARRAVELKSQGRENLITDGMITEGLKLADKHPYFVEAFDQYQEYNRNMIDFYVDAGYITEDTAKQIKARNRAYVPFHRVSEGVTEAFTGSGSGFQQLKGGTQNIRHIYDNIIHQDSKHIQAALKARAMRSLYKGLLKSDDGAEFISKIGPDTKPVQMAIDQMADKVSRAMSEVGAEIEGLSGKETKEEIVEYFEDNPEEMMFWTFGHKPKTSETMVDSFIDVDGQRVWIEINKDNKLLPDMLDSLDGVATPDGVGGFLFRVARALKQFTTLSITTMPQFVLPNIIRDQQQAFILSGGKYRPILDSFRGMRLVLKDKLAKSPIFRDLMDQNTLISEMKAQGGPGGGKVKTMLEAEWGFATRQGYADRKAWYRPTSLAKDVYDIFVGISDLAEMGTRAGFYSRLRKEGATPMEAAYQAREISTDFAKHGSYAAFVRLQQTVPFFGAAVQGTDRDLRGLLDHKGNVRLKNIAQFNEMAGRIKLTGSLYVSAFIMIALMSANEDDEQVKTELAGLTPDQKARFFHFWFDTGEKDSNGKPIYKHMTLPKGYGFFPLMGQLAEEITSASKGQPMSDAEKNMAFALGHHLSFEAIPGVVRPFWELSQNKTFTGAPIVPMSAQNLSPELQFTDRNQQIWRKLGSALNVSPAKAQHVFRGMAGYMETFISEASEAYLWNYEEWGERPTIGGLGHSMVKQISPGTVPYRTKYTDQYYELRQRAVTAAADISFVKGLAKKNALPNSEAFDKYVNNEFNQVMGSLTKAFRSLDAKLAKGRESTEHILRNKDLSGEEKTEQIEMWYKTKNKLIKDQYQALIVEVEKLESKVRKDK